MMKKNTKIKILFRLRSLEMGGVPRVVLDLLRNLPINQFELTLMLNLCQGELVSEIPENINLIVIEKGREQMSKNTLIRKIQLIIRRLKLEVYNQFPSLLYALKVKDKFDIEVAPGYAEFEMVLNSPNKKSKKIGWFHTDVGYDTNKKRVLKRINLMKKFDWMIFGSSQTRQIIDDLYKIKYPKSSVIYNVIKLSEVRKKADEFSVNFNIHPTFVSIGRLHHRKGYAELMRVHKRLLDENHYHSIAVIGGGNEMGNLQQQAKELGVEKTFLLLNSQKNPWPYVKAADYFVLTSKSESYPLTIGEVMGLHKPIIATNVGGIPEMIEDGKDGVLVNFDENEIFKAMKNFLTNPDLVKTITEGTKIADEKFDEHKIYQQVTEVFQQQYRLINP
jgi:glycosyltransferase involved in cell wall biosynthesis